LSNDSGVGDTLSPTDGEFYDEKDSHASFLEALSEWRTGRAVSAVTELVRDGASRSLSI
jgi:hypothetical protein